MRISPVGSVGGLQPIVSIKPVSSSSVDGISSTSDGSENVSFGAAMKKAVGEVNSLQSKADDMAVKLATGDVEDVHKAMLAMNKAKLAFDFTLQVRNKVIEAYQEIMRMPV